MGKYIYKAYDNTGHLVEDELKAEDKKQALDFIQQNGLYPFKLQEISDPNFTTFSSTDIESGNKFKDRTGSFSFNVRGKKGDLMLFTRQLANLLGAGIQLGEALKIITELLKPDDFKETVKSVYSDLKGGKDFADALSKYPEYFSPGFISMVKAGEEGGFLAITFQRLLEYLETKEDLKSFLISSLVYPFILMIVAFLAIVVMITYVLPKFMSIYNSYNQSLPLPTRILLDISYIFQKYGVGILLIIIVIISGLIFFYKSKQGKIYIDKMFITLPFIRNYVINISLINLTRSTGTMLESGVSLLKALNVSKYITSNIIIQEAIEVAAVKVKRGRSFSEALASTDVFPPIVISMIGIGEETGKIDVMLIQIADNFEKEIKKALETMMKVFEPVIILVMGVIIGFIVIAMLLPVLGLNNYIF